MAFLFLSYAYFTPAAQWNENSRFNLTRAVVERGSLNIDPYHKNTGDKSYHDGHYYTDKAPGVSILGIPGYTLLLGMRKLAGKPLPRQKVLLRPAPKSLERGRHKQRVKLKFNAAYMRGLYMTNLLSNGLLAALAGTLLFGFLLGGKRKRLGKAVFGTAVYGLGTMVWPYATLFYGHQVAGSLFVIVVVWAGVPGHTPPGQQRPLSHPHTLPPSPTPLKTTALGALLGVIVASDYPSAVPAALTAAYLTLRVPTVAAKLKTAAWLAGGALPIGVLLALYHTACFGGPFSLGYQHLATPEFARGMSQGLYGVTWPRFGIFLRLLFGPHRGLFYTSPVLLLSAYGLYRFWKRGVRAFALLAAASFLYFLLLNSAYYMWNGGAAFGPRHVIPALAFLAFGVGYAYPNESGTFPWRKIICWLAFAYGAANMLAATSVGPEAPLDIYDPMLEYIWPNFFYGCLAQNMGSANLGLLLGLPGLKSLLPLAALWLLCGATFCSLVPQRKHVRPKTSQPPE